MMRKRDIVGRKVVAMEWLRITPNHGRPVMHVMSLKLDNGTMITFDTHECENGYAIEGTAHHPPRRS